MIELRPALLCALLALVCPAQTQKVPELPCFPDDGEVAFLVDGVPVPAKAVQRFADLLAVRHPAMSETARVKKAIEEGIIPQAAVYALHRAHVQKLSERAAKVKERLDAGESFEAVSRDSSDDPSRFADSTVGTFSRTPGATLSLGLEGPVFRAKEGEVVGPVVTAVGIQFAKIKKITPNEDPRGEQREVAHILLHIHEGYGNLLRSYKPGTEDPKLAADLAKAGDENMRALRSARVTVKDERFRSLVFPYRLAQGG